MAQRKNPSKKTEMIQAEVKQIELLSKKKLKAVDDKLSKGDVETKKGYAKVKEELDYLGKSEETEEWKLKVIQVSNEMKELLKSNRELQQTLLNTTEQIAREIEQRMLPLKKELPTVLDFSESDRVQLAGVVDRALVNVKKKQEEIRETEQRLQRQLDVVNENTPDPSWAKEMTVKKLQMSYDTMARVDDPEVVRSEMLLALAAAEPKKGNTHPPRPKQCGNS